jgi:ubiquinone/menaquinone biosynthesis C-methylase UbiE
MTGASDREDFWKKVRDTYSDRRAKQWNTVGNPIAFVEGQDNQISLVLRGLLRDGIVLVDFGCGAGKLMVQCIQAIDRGTLIGVDISRRMCSIAMNLLRVMKPHGMFRVVMIVGPLELCPLPENLADVAVAKMVLHHVLDPALALQQMARVIRPGGHLLIMVPGKMYQAEFFDPANIGEDPLGRFSLDELENLAVSARLFPQNAYINRFRFWFDNLYDYFVFMDGIGATSKLFGYQPGPMPTMFVDTYRPVLERTPRFAVSGEYITLDCVKDVSWVSHSLLITRGGANNANWANHEEGYVSL